MKVLITDMFNDSVIEFAKRHNISKICVFTDEVIKPESDGISIETVPLDLWKNYVHEIIDENIEAIYIWINDVKMLLKLSKEILIKFPEVYIVYNNEII
mgnify:CR=1 FL=1